MKRDLAALANRQFDLVVIGGGIFGACAAWDAAQRGLSVALVERGDFASATSANSFKMVHGGIRYLQHGDISRLRQSSRERRVLLSVAPQHIRPLPIVIPTYGYGWKGGPLLRLGAGLYDCLTADRNFGMHDPARRIPWTRFLSRKQLLEMFPAVPREGVTGAAVFHDAQIHNPPRLVFAFLQRAVEAGAVAANYVTATGFARRGRRISEVHVRDVLDGSRFSVRARVVLNAAGPYAESLLKSSLGVRLSPQGTYSRDACFVVPRRLLNDRHALALLGRTLDPDAVVSRGRRHLFVVPWRDYTLVGVWHVVYSADPDRFRVTEDELQGFVDEINEACPALDLSLDDISMCNSGLVPFGDNAPGSKDLRYGHRSRLLDHSLNHGIDNLLTLIGVRFTTGRYEAVKAVDRVFRKLGRKTPRSQTHRLAVAGGDVADFAAYRERAVHRHRKELDGDVVRSLVDHYGTQYGTVLRRIDGDSSLGERIGSSSVIEAQVQHAAREEMAQTLGDVLFRRTDLATGAFPGHGALLRCAARLAKDLGWSLDREEREIADVLKRFPKRVTEGIPQEV